MIRRPLSPSFQKGPDISASSRIPKTNRSHALPIIPPAGNAIEVNHLTVRYGKRTVLRDVNFSASRGKVTALVGPSGCGKSTFLSTLNRLTDLVPHCHVAGEIWIDHCRIDSPDCDLGQLRRRIGMVFQKPNPFAMSIRKNIAMPLKEHRYPKSEIADRVKDALDKAGLWGEVKDRMNQSALQLSGGQMQRLCIARALALEPEIMVFDEPCSALDPASSDVVENLIASFGGQLTVLIVTHNLSQAKRIADDVSVFWMRKEAGTIIESGPLKRVFENPDDPTAGAFLQGRRG